MVGESSAAPLKKRAECSTRGECMAAERGKECDRGHERKRGGKPCWGVGHYAFSKGEGHARWEAAPTALDKARARSSEREKKNRRSGSRKKRETAERLRKTGKNAISAGKDSSPSKKERHSARSGDPMPASRLFTMPWE